ncbi:MAG: F0F1 ATP synthase subunit epsilon [Planctomycetota bacterium]|nr:MAG: F0F1 ATP synthase subunit epsilon [Planctomycetota bacterium]
MAARSFACTLITPAARVFDEDATEAILPLHDGSAGVLPRRAPFVAELGVGEFRVTFAEGGSRSFYVDSGFAQMTGDRLTLLAEAAIPAEELSLSEAEAELAEAVARKPQNAEEMEQVSATRRRARAKVSVARGFKQSGSGI